MAHDCAIAQRFLRKQKQMFRLAARDCGITQKMVHLETHMGLTSIGEYARGEKIMGGDKIARLAAWDDFPSELLSILIDGSGKHFADDDGGGHCLDLLGNDADEVAADVRRARAPESPGGTEIVHEEELAIRRKAKRLQRKAASA